MRLSDVALAAVMREPGWTLQLRDGDAVVAEVKVNPVLDSAGWRVDALFGPWGEQKSWTDVALVSDFGVEELEPSASSLARGTVYGHTVRVTADGVSS